MLAFVSAAAAFDVCVHAFFPHQVLLGLSQACSSGSGPAAMRQAVPKATVVGLFRDLRGIVAATTTRRTYCLVFDWLYPAHFPTILACLDAWGNDTAVTTPLLKFVAEFCYNKSQRLVFDSSSPNGILLFREVSKVRGLQGAHLRKLDRICYNINLIISARIVT